jgi:hypothetical protein
MISEISTRFMRVWDAEIFGLARIFLSFYGVFWTNLCVGRHPLNHDGGQNADCEEQQDHQPIANNPRKRRLAENAAPLLGAHRDLMGLRNVPVIAQWPK